MRDLHLTEKIELEFVYQYDLAKITFITCVERDDCILPKWRLSTDAIPFKRLKFQIVNKKISQKISKKIKLAEVISSDKKKRH